MRKWCGMAGIALICASCGGGAETPVQEPAAAATADAGATAETGGSAAPAAAPRPAVPAAPRRREVTVPAGTMLRLELRSAVASDTSRVEDVVSASLREAVILDGGEVLPAGTEVSGHVTAVERAGRVRGRAQIAYRFNEIMVGGERLAIQAEPVSHLAPATKGEDATKVAVGAGAGAALGALLGGGDGAAKGAAVGAAAGTGVVLATRGDEVRRGPGDEVTTRLTGPVTIRIGTR